MMNADTAMCHTKEQGRSGSQLYAACMSSHFHERMALENDLRHALERNELLLFYQPQTDLSSGRIVAAEALLRWQHPKRGLILPGEFIPLAEQSGLIVPIGEWVLRAACASMKRWHDAGIPPIRIAVNLSVQQFLQPSLIQMVAMVLAESGLPAQFLELEITESCLMPVSERAAGSSANTYRSALLHDKAIETLRMLKQLGVRIAVDDFGTGYTNLGYLKKLPLDSLKIGQSFIRNLATDHNDAAIVKAIIAISASLGLHLVAEGVETAEQLQLLRQYQCALAQGHLLGQPVSAEAFERFLQKAANDALAAQSKCAVVHSNINHAVMTLHPRTRSKNSIAA
ncbi:MAG: EAL domain-containing protein [Nitrosomonadaceae bacterium]|nr:MAG: EAL domain-containing protein [Nitrosomonadaceae bacterium]